MLSKIKHLFHIILLICLTQVQAQTPPVVSASGDQIYCPLTSINIVTDFNIVDADSQVTAVYIQISTGYTQGEDRLSYSGTNPNIMDSWSSSEGKLTLTYSGTVSLTELIDAVKEVVFESNSTTPSGEKYFSITISEANYLPSTGHYYEYVEALGITWSEARDEAETRNYYGLQGYLATITSVEEAQLSGEQASGAGWLGGTDWETEGVWKWVTGPEAGTVFWNGGINGSTPNYANWNTNEPNNLGDEDYVHVTAPNIGRRGSWNDLPNTGGTGDYEPKGYIVEYGGMPGDPVLTISASTKITIPEIVSVTNNSTCDSGSVQLSAIQNVGNILWFDSETSTTPLHNGNNFTTPTLVNTTTYYVLASVNGCTSGKRTAVIATINPLPNIETTVDFKNCDEDGNPDGFTDFNLNEVIPIITKNDNSLTVTFHLTEEKAENNNDAQNPLPFNNATASTIYARVENSFGCFDISTVNLEVSTTSLPTSFNFELTTCDNDGLNDGYHTFDLTEATTEILSQLPPQNLSVHYFKTVEDAQLEQNEILPQNDYININSHTETLYIRVENDDDGNCYGIGPHLNLIVHSLPEFEVTPEAFVCLNLDPITIEITNAEDDYTYEWTNENDEVISNESSAIISEGGTYSVIAFSDLNCESSPKTIDVSESNIASVSLDDIVIIDDSNNNSIEINTQNLGIGDYEFALNDDFGPYQNEPFFNQLAPGIHTLYIRDKNGCGITQIEVPIMGFPKFFTPNNDGFNDTWNIKGFNTEFYESSFIYIFDRYGKNVAVIDTENEGWNGSFNNVELPSSDYWFWVQLTDKNGNIRERRGNFSLIRK